MAGGKSAFHRVSLCPPTRPKRFKRGSDHVRTWLWSKSFIQRGYNEEKMPVRCERRECCFTTILRISDTMSDSAVRQFPIKCNDLRDQAVMVVKKSALPGRGHLWISDINPIRMVGEFIEFIRLHA